MLQFLHRNLFLSSIGILILFSGCSPLFNYKYTKSAIADSSLVRPVVDPNAALLYKSNIKIYNKQYSGLVVLKQTNAATSHLTFITEVGMKIFDFEITNDKFELVYLFEPLNKPEIKKLLEKDMKLLLLHSLFGQESRIYRKGESTILFQKDPQRQYYFIGEDKNIKMIQVKGLILKKEKVNFTYNNDHAEKIILKHYGLIRLRMEFNRINKLAE